MLQLMKLLNPKLIIQPKSIIGFMPLNTRDKKAQIVVRTSINWENIMIFGIIFLLKSF